MGDLDAHLKNWTLRYPDGRTPRLSPAYDLVAVAAYPESREDKLAFSLSGAQRARLITGDHFRRIDGSAISRSCGTRNAAWWRSATP